MLRNTLLGSVVLVCLAAESLAAVGDPTGTTYGVSGKNHGQADGGFGAGTFGADLLYYPDYTLTPDLTGDAQLGPGGGSPLSMTFDGSPGTFGNLEFNESHQIYDGSGLGIYNDLYGYTSANPLVLGPNTGAGDVPFGWNTPGHLVEFSLKDTLGGVADQGGFTGGTYQNPLFESAVIRYDNVMVDGTTGGSNQAVPVFPADREPINTSLAPYGLDGKWVASYFYFKSHGVPVNPTGSTFADGVLAAQHPNIPGQDIFMIITDYSAFDLLTTHGIGPGTFGASWDLSVIAPGANLYNIAAGIIVPGSPLGIDNPDSIDEIVFGYIYRMIAASDANEDGKVDGLDYLTWAAHYGTDPVNPPAPDMITPAPGRTFGQSLGDYNSDGHVDGLDYLVWASEYGFVGDGSDQLASSVPEPSSILALATGLLMLCGMARKPRRR